MTDDPYVRDRDLVERALGGDESATREVAAMLSDLTALALRKLGSKGVHIIDPQNVSAEVRFLVLSKDSRSTLGRYQARSSLRTFLWRVVSYKVIDLTRRQRLDPPTQPLEGIEVPTFEGPTERLWDIVRALADYLDGQEPLVRLILQGRWVDELSYAEIAQKAWREMKQRPSRENIGAVLFQHRKKLRERLRSLGLISTN